MTQEPRPGDEPDWIDRVVDLAGRLGMNEVRLRWKLMGLRDRVAGLRGRSAAAVEHARYEHKVCPECGALNDREEPACHQCELPLPSHRWQVFTRLLGLGNRIATVTTALTGLILLVYLREIAASPGAWLLTLDPRALIRHGGYAAAFASQYGEWWRLGTACFLHIGVLHLGFNLAALRVVGPAVETALGSARAVFLFMATGIGANLLSHASGAEGISAGASGALMGWIGVITGWAQREGTVRAHELRDSMIHWALFVLLFGFAVNSTGGGVRVDNAAHLGGLGLGLVLGFAMHPRWLRRRADSKLDTVLGALGWLAVLGSVGAILFPPELHPALQAFVDSGR